MNTSREPRRTDETVTVGLLVALALGLLALLWFIP
jgi:hypothetical protein